MEEKDLTLEEMLAEEPAQKHAIPFSDLPQETHYNVPEIIEDAIRNLDEAELGEPIKIEGTQIVLSSDFAKAYKQVNELSEKLSTAIKTAKDMLLEEMEKAYKETGNQKTENNGLAITYKVPTTSEKFDSKRFAEEHPDLYKQYTIFSTVKGSLLIKVKDK